MNMDYLEFSGAQLVSRKQMGLLAFRIRESDVYEIQYRGETEEIVKHIHNQIFTRHKEHTPHLTNESSLPKPKPLPFFFRVS